MGGINLNKKLWRMPQQGMVRGVCAGIAQYLDVPVKLGAYPGGVIDLLWSRVTLVAYIILSLYWTRCRTAWQRASNSLPAVNC